jgi:4'-phosphopantetheinyl transferase
MRSVKNNNWKHETPSVSCFQLSNNEICIWAASLEQTPECTAEFLSILSRDEKERAKRFYFERDRNHYIAGRGMLRTLLGNYLETEPARVEFIYGVHGKPALGAPFNGKNFEFNLSHSKDQALYAFNWGQPIGVDIEYVQSMKDMDDFAAQFFTHNECKLIHSLSKDQKQETFFKIWTCKEAFLKANGSGLTTPINQVEVSFANEGTISLTSIGADLEQAAYWRLKMFTPIAGYQAALAIGRNEKRIIFQQLDHL